MTAPRPNTETDLAGWFSRMSAENGIDFRHVSGTNEEKPFPAANGSGLAAFDFDRDGWSDLYFATGTPFPLPDDGKRSDPTNRLYRNLGPTEQELQFQDVTGCSGLGHTGYTAGVTVADYDNDGFPDVYLACFGANGLFRNQGDGTFQRMPASAGVDDPRWATSAAFLDYDNDGALDLYVCNYARWSWETNQFCGDRVRKIRIYCSPHSVQPVSDALFRNLGDGTFAEVTGPVGLAERKARAQGVIVADLNNDGHVDIYVGNDLNANSLFLNQGDGTFQDATESSGVGYDNLGGMQAGMGVAAADTNQDGLLELFVTNFADEHNAFYENTGQGLFVDVAHQQGLASAGLPWVGWGTAFADFNLDGLPDLVVTNGHVDDNLQQMGQKSPYEAPPLLWKNVQGRFEFLGETAGDYFRQPHVGRALAVADLDEDGDPDLIIGHQDAAPALLRNNRLVAGGPTPASIVLRLVGTVSNRDAVGSRLKWTTSSVSLNQQITHGGSYLSCHDPRQVLALPAGEGEQARLEITWPRGTKTTLQGFRSGGKYVVVEPADAQHSAELVPLASQP